MKTLKGLNDKPSLLEEQIEKQKETGIVPNQQSFKRMIRDAINKSLAKSGENAIERHQIWSKLMQDEDDILLEDAEFKILKDTCSENPIQWMVHFQSQVALKFQEAEKRAEEEDKKKKEEKKKKKE